MAACWSEQLLKATATLYNRVFHRDADQKPMRLAAQIKKLLEPHLPVRTVT